MGYRCETHLQLSDTAVLCVKFQDDCIIDMDVMDERYFVRFESKMHSDEYPILHSTLGSTAPAP